MLPPCRRASGPRLADLGEVGREGVATCLLMAAGVPGGAGSLCGLRPQLVASGPKLTTKHTLQRTHVLV